MMAHPMICFPSLAEPAGFAFESIMWVSGTACGSRDGIENAWPTIKRSFRDVTQSDNWKRGEMIE
jgi:hypothetical protein